MSRRRRWLAALGLLPLLQACSPLRLINATVASGTHTVQRDLAYGSEARQRADVYLPAVTTRNAPIAVFFYGGSWSSGDRGDYRFVGEALASHGVVTVVADYRLSPEVQVAFEWPKTPADSQPLFHARAGHAKPGRTLLLAAKSDLLVNPQRNTVALAQALQQQGAAVDVTLFERVNHATLIGAMARPLRGLAPVLERVSGFLNPPSA